MDVDIGIVYVHMIRKNLYVVLQNFYLKLDPLNHVAVYKKKLPQES